MVYRGAMRLAEFSRLVESEFGAAHGKWLLSTHVLSGLGVTADEAIDRGDDVREIWWALCRDNDIPKDRWLGPDLMG